MQVFNIPWLPQAGFAFRSKDRCIRYRPRFKRQTDALSVETLLIEGLPLRERSEIRAVGLSDTVFVTFCLCLLEAQMALPLTYKS